MTKKLTFHVESRPLTLYFARLKSVVHKGNVTLTKSQVERIKKTAGRLLIKNTLVTCEA